MKTLDRSRPYGEVFGVGHARYEQDHILFDAHGNAMTDAESVTEAEPTTQPAPTAKRGRKAKEVAIEAPKEPVTAADAQLDAQLAG